MGLWVAHSQRRAWLYKALMIFLIFALVLTAMMGTFLDYFGGVIHQMLSLK